MAVTCGNVGIALFAISKRGGKPLFGFPSRAISTGLLRCRFNSPASRAALEYVAMVKKTI